MKSTSQTTARREGRVSKRDWFVAALAELERSGVEAVRVERLAKQLSVAKSGFYWHFKDRKDLLKQVLEYWSNEFTEIVATFPKAQRGEPSKRLLEIARIIDEENLAKYDLAIRAWAAHDADAADVVRKVTQYRLDYIGSIFAEMGFKGDELEARTRLFVGFHSTEEAMFLKATKQKRTRLRRQQLKILTQTA